MIQFSDIHPLTSFLRDHKAHLERLAKHGRPEVLTVNGKARVIVQDAESYQRLLDLLDRAESERIVRERFASVQRGEPGVDVDEAFDRIRKQLGLRKKKKSA